MAIKVVGIIPARYQSTRFPGKPLANLGGKSVIQWVYENASKALDAVWVATDDERIMNAVRTFGGQVVKTSPLHQSGTDRCAEAAQSIGGDFDVVINIQGDEPFVTPGQIEALAGCFDAPEVQIATLVKKIERTEELFNPNRPKVVVGAGQQALYFSRQAIPFFRGRVEEEWLEAHPYWAHIGMYAFRAPVLQQITMLPQGKLEKAESLEQLRWLENGFNIRVAETQVETIGIDTPEDLETAENYLRTRFDTGAI